MRRVVRWWVREVVRSEGMWREERRVVRRDILTCVMNVWNDGWRGKGGRFVR